MQVKYISLRFLRGRSFVTKDGYNIVRSRFGRKQSPFQVIWAERDDEPFNCLIL